MAIYFLFDAKLMNEFATAFYSFTALVSAIFYYLSHILQRDELFAMIKKFEDFIEKRKLVENFRKFRFGKVSK